MKLFGIPPKTVWENLKNFDDYPEKVAAVADGIMDELTLDSYRAYIVNGWSTEYHFRNIPNAMDDIKECVKAHGIDATDFDEASWEEINHLRFDIAKDSLNEKCLLTRAREALDRKDYDTASDLQIEIQQKVEELKKKYADYKRNLF